MALFESDPEHSLRNTFPAESRITKGIKLAQREFIQDEYDSILEKNLELRLNNLRLLRKFRNRFKTTCAAPAAAR
jgi:hypothetical protein